MPKKEVQKKEEIVVKKAAKINYTFAVGRRKTAIANVNLTKGTGKIVINNKEISSPNRVYTEPLKMADLEKKMDCWISVKGGGIVAQLEAIRLGISRALVKNDPGIRKTLKLEGFLTRDPRMKERKKPGLKGARRAPQWQKR